jgi:hypothetical protein
VRRTKNLAGRVFAGGESANLGTGGTKDLVFKEQRSYAGFGSTNQKEKISSIDLNVKKKN